MVARRPRRHDGAMFESILFALAIVIIPAAIVFGSLALLGLAVAALADVGPNGLIRPTAS
jgi:hypothetical protein